ncbi:MAG: sugar ABC transporter permease, partial [Chloroflexota bacterium]
MRNHSHFRRLPYKFRLHLLLLPYVSGIVVLVLVPAVLSFSLAFFHYDGLSAPQWAGSLNFILAYTDELFQLSVENSLA